MKKIIYIVAFTYLFIFCIPVFARDSYEIELAPIFREYYKTILDEDTKDEFVKNSNVHIAVDILKSVLQNYPGTLTACEMISFISHVRFWENDTIMKKRYLEMREKYLNVLDDPNTDTVDKLLFMILFSDVDYRYTLNEEETKKACELCTKGLIKMKDECKNRDYQALAIYCLLSISRSYNAEILDKFSDHPISFIAQKNVIVYKYYFGDDHDSYDRHVMIEELKQFGEKHKKKIIPGGWNFEIATYDCILWNYADYLKEYENAEKYLKLIEEKAPDYYRLKNLRDMLEQWKKSK